MNKNIKIDIKDRKLIHFLELDARSSLTKIAKKIGVSKEVANYRLGRLLRRGIIKRFYALVDNVLLDYKIYRIVIDLHNLRDGTREAIINDLKRKRNIDVNVFLQSSRDIEISLYVRHPREFYDFYYGFFNKYAKCIGRKNLSVVTKQYFFGNRYLHGYNKQVKLGEDYKVHKLDSLDYDLIDILMLDPRISVLDISKKMKISPSAIIHRLRNLLSKEIVKGYGVVLDKGLLGYSSYRVEIILNDLSKKREAISYLRNIKNVNKISEFVGEMDLDFEADFKTVSDLDRFLDKLRIDIPYIKNFEVINVVRD